MYIAMLNVNEYNTKLHTCIKNINSQMLVYGTKQNVSQNFNVDICSIYRKCNYHGTIRQIQIIIMPFNGDTCIYLYVYDNNLAAR